MFGRNEEVQADFYSNHKEQMTVKELLAQVKSRLAIRGTRGINAIGRSFRIADDNRNQSLDQDEFVKCMHDFKIGLSKEDCARLFQSMDENKSGDLDYEEYLYMIVGEMNAFRQNLAM